MHENRRAIAARTTWLPLLLSLGAWSSAALAQAPSGATPGSPTPGSPTPGGPTPASAAKPAATAAPAGSAPAVAKPAPATSTSTKPKRKLPMRACPAKVPEALNPSPDVTLETVLPASGVQSYVCTIEKPGEAPDWAPKGPHATLGEGNNLMGIHFGGPSWQAMDGSLVKGSKLSSASAPDKSAIVWLLLSGTPSGEGVFGKITHIQRMDTVGGRPPQGGCDQSHLDSRVLVPYRANYYFYREAAPGETIRQCRGAPGKAAAGNKGENEKPATKPSGKKAAKASSDKHPAEKASGNKPTSEKGTSAKPASE